MLADIGVGQGINCVGFMGFAGFPEMFVRSWMRWTVFRALVIGLPVVVNDSGGRPVSCFETVYWRWGVDGGGLCFCRAGAAAGREARRVAVECLCRSNEWNRVSMMEKANEVLAAGLRKTKMSFLLHNNTSPRILYFSPHLAIRRWCNLRCELDARLHCVCICTDI
ncbi:hypothetical protein BJ170DRAFT_455670 [Xylariales sp. AK1849]|nr:hypothetical protein BJ170DRAFT_455670 [Xylariales sp. AK1849]